MPVTAWKYAGTGANDSSFGDSFSDWTSPGNITAEDGSVADASITSSSFANESYYLKGTSFGFTTSDVPSDATVDGIELRILRRQSASSGVKDLRVRLVKGGTIGTTDRADTSTDWPTSLAKATYGSSSDLWGDTWSPSDIHSNNFGAVLSAGNSPNSRIAYVDSFEIRVHYTEAAGGVEEGDGASAGAATVTGEGKSTAKSDGAAPGTATASGQGKSTHEADGTSAGTATVTATGDAVSSANGSSAGIATVAAVGIAIFTAVGTSAGSATASGEGKADAVSVGTASAVAIVTGDASSTAVAEGTSAGSATVTGDGEAAIVADGSELQAAHLSRLLPAQCRRNLSRRCNGHRGRPVSHDCRRQLCRHRNSQRRRQVHRRG